MGRAQCCLCGQAGQKLLLWLIYIIFWSAFKQLDEGTRARHVVGNGVEVPVLSVSAVCLDNSCC